MKAEEDFEEANDDALPTESEPEGYGDTEIEEIEKKRLKE